MPADVVDMLFEAIAAAGVRAIISAGWAGLGKEKENADPNILIWSSMSAALVELTSQRTSLMNGSLPTIAFPPSCTTVAPGQRHVA